MDFNEKKFQIVVRGDTRNNFLKFMTFFRDDLDHNLENLGWVRYVLY